MKIGGGDVALITGASRGLGRHIAMALGRRGMDLVLAARSQDGLDAVAEQVRSATGVTVWTLTVDLGAREQAAGLAARAVEAAGHVDLLVNNAGLESIMRPDEAPLEHLGAMTDVNLLAPMVLTRTVLPGMIDRGRGHVVNMASMSGLLAMAYQESYNASKFGLVGYTRALRLSAQDQGWGISASVICPGLMTGEGIFENLVRDYGLTVPKTVGSLPVELVGDAVVKAVEKDLPDVLLSPGVPRAIGVAAIAIPRLFERLVHRLRLPAMLHPVITQRSAAVTPES
jgi:short-subunit dehydrogenase